MSVRFDQFLRTAGPARYQADWPPHGPWRPRHANCRVEAVAAYARAENGVPIGASGLPSPLGTSTCRRSGLDISDRSVPKSVKAHAARIGLDGANFSAHSQGLDSCCASSTWLR
jgi:hypothetical protein